MLQSTVSDIVRRNRSTEGNNDSEKRGRKKKFSPRSERSYLKHVRRNKFKSLRVITAEYNEFHQEKTSMCNVRRVLPNHGIQNYVAVAKPFLTTRYMKRRMEWARTHTSNGLKINETLI